MESQMSTMCSLIVISSCSGKRLLLGSGNLLADLLFSLLEGKLDIALILLAICGDAVANTLVLNCLRIFWRVRWIFFDLGMSIRVHVLNISTANTCSNEL